MKRCAFFCLLLVPACTVNVDIDQRGGPRPDAAFRADAGVFTADAAPTRIDAAATMDAIQVLPDASP